LGKGKPWSVGQEKQLRELVKAGKTVDELAGELKKSPGAIKKKLRRLGLEVVVPIEKKKFTGRLLLLFVLLFLMIFQVLSISCVNWLGR